MERFHRALYNGSKELALEFDHCNKSIAQKQAHTHRDPRTYVLFAVVILVAKTSGKTKPTTTTKNCCTVEIALILIGRETVIIIDASKKTE